VYGHDAFNLFGCVAQRLLCATLQAGSYHTSSLRAARVDPIVVRSIIPYHILHTSPPGAGISRDHFLGDPTKSDGILGHKTTLTRIDIGRFSGVYYAFA